MVKFVTKLIKEQRGSTVVLVGMSLLLLLTVAGLVIDGGTMYAAKSHLQKTANAAALSGAQELTGQESDVQEIVNDILSHHGEQASLTRTDINMKSTVRVHLSKKIPLGFGRLFGKKDVTVAVKAAARILPMSAAKGAVPLGIDSRIPLNYYQPYRLKVDMEGSDTGFFGILALGGPGAQTYEQNLKNGYSYEIKVGDIIETETGKVEGKTRDGVNFRIDSDPYPEGDYNHRDSTRVILIPVYEPYEQTSNQMKRIKVVGFAYFYILEPMSHQDSEINGYFIERADTAFASPGTPDTGAYAIKLVE